jgi:hypothetical protein
MARRLLLSLLLPGLALGLRRADKRDMAQDYLAKFGYLTSSSSGKTAALQSLDSAVESFQAFAGLKQTGKLDAETVSMMRIPRCGVKDFLEEDDDTPRQGWRPRPLTPYLIS